MKTKVNTKKEVELKTLFVDAGVRPASWCGGLIHLTFYGNESAEILEES